jgi:hypothetical protein
MGLRVGVVGEVHDVIEIAMVGVLADVKDGDRAGVGAGDGLEALDAGQFAFVRSVMVEEAAVDDQDGEIGPEKRRFSATTNERVFIGGSHVHTYGSEEGQREPRASVRADWPLQMRWLDLNWCRFKVTAEIYELGWRRGEHYCAQQENLQAAIQSACPGHLADTHRGGPGILACGGALCVIPERGSRPILGSCRRGNAG